MTTLTDQTGRLILKKDSIITGEIGSASKKLAEIELDSPDDAIYSPQYVNTAKFISAVRGTLTINDNIDSQFEFAKDVNGVASLSPGVRINNDVITQTDGSGILHLHENNTITGQTGSSTHALNTILTSEGAMNNTVADVYTYNIQMLNNSELTANALSISSGGSLILGADSILTADSISGDANYSFTLTATGVSSININGTAPDLSGSTLTVTTWPVTLGGVIFDGEQEDRILIDSASDSAVLPSLSNINLPSFALFDLSVVKKSGNDSDIFLNILRTATPEDVADSFNKSLASVIDSYSGSNSNLVNFKNLVMSSGSTKEVNDNLERGSNKLIQYSGAEISQTTARQAGQIVLDRVQTASGRNRNSFEGVSTGNVLQEASSWVQVFGQYISQGKREDFRGYDATTWGIALGVDKQYGNNLLLGTAFSYTNIYLSVEENYAKSNINNFQFSIYGSYDITENWYVSAQTSYVLGYNANSRYNAGLSGKTAEGSFFSNQWLTQTQLGYAFDIYDSMTLIPVLLNTLNYYGSNSYTESGAGGANLHVGSSNLWNYSLGGGVNYEWKIQLSDYTSLIPSLFAGYSISLLNPAVSGTAQFTGGGAEFSTEGMVPGRDSFLLNTGILYEASDSIEVRLDYNLIVKDKFTSQTGILKASYLF